MSRVIKHKAARNLSKFLFAAVILYTLGLLVYAARIAEWQWNSFLIFTSKTLVIEGIMLPLVGILVAHYIHRAPTWIEEMIGALLLLICWVSSLEIMYGALAYVTVMSHYA